MFYWYIKEYTDLQLRLGLIKWLMCFVPSSGRAQDDSILLEHFEKILYQKVSKGDISSTLLEFFLENAKDIISPHPGIPKEKKSIILTKEQTLKGINTKSSKKATKDILDWASSIGLLTKPSISGGRAVTKRGSYFLRLTGADVDLKTKIAKQEINPFKLNNVERRYLFTTEISKDPVLIPLIVKLSKKFPNHSKFVRSGDGGRRVVQELIKSFQDIHTALTKERKLSDAHDLKNHMKDLQQDINKRNIHKGCSRTEVLKPFKPRAKKEKPSEHGFKTAKHRLTPRLEHLSDYKFIQFHKTNQKNEYTWSVSENGYRAADYLKKLPKNALYSGTNVLPKMKEFFRFHLIGFFAYSEHIKINKRLNWEDTKSSKEFLKYLCYSYNTCAPTFGYAEAWTIFIIASLHALDDGFIIELDDLFKFLIKKVGIDPSLSHAFSFASRAEIEKLHIKINNDFVKKNISKAN